MLKIIPIEITDMAGITKLTCPRCNEKVPRVGILKGSKISSLTFKCKKCGRQWEVQTE